MSFRGVGNTVVTPAGVTRPTPSMNDRANQMFPSGPGVIGPMPDRPAATCVTTPALVVVISLSSIEKYSFPSVPSVMSPGVPDSENWVKTPAGVMRPRAAGSLQMNQRLPSVPAVIDAIPNSGTGKMVIAPVVETRSIFPLSVNQMLPSGPTVGERGRLPAGRL